MVLLHGINLSSHKVPELCSPHLMCIMDTSRRPRECNLRVSHSKSRETSDQQKVDDSVDQILLVKGKNTKIEGPPGYVLWALVIKGIVFLLALWIIAYHGLPGAVVTAIGGWINYVK